MTHPKASLLSCSEVLSELSTHERQKKRQYGVRVINVDRGIVTPLLFFYEWSIYLQEFYVSHVSCNHDC